MISIPGSAIAHWLRFANSFAFTLAILQPQGVFADDRSRFLKEIRSLLATNCFPCHGPDAKERQAGLRLDLSDAAREKLFSGTVAIVPGQPDNSELIRRIETTDSSLAMPPPASNKTLTLADKQSLRRWIESGADYAQHWAYLAPIRPAIPTTADTLWSRNGIDAFVLANIESAGISPAVIASNETLVRRLSLDLIGLPPTVDDLQTYLADSSADAYERAVDRLLASPHYGEKLAQEWLDLARFGDTSGYQDDNDRPNYPYRDVVIDAFNANVPFDQFTIESLAGDLLPNPTTAQRVLSGFNRLHRYNEEGGSDPEEFRVVYAVDRTNTTAATWMGISFGCAQCHDHKYDPFAQREYYQFLAFFNSLKGEITVSKGPANPPQIRVPKPPEQRELAALDIQIAEQEKLVKSRESEIKARFESWVKQSTTTTRPKIIEGAGAIGGTVARRAHRAYYADTNLDGELTSEVALKSSGKVTVVRAVDNDVEVGHFTHTAGTKYPGIGWSVAEGPRFFAHLALPNGDVFHSKPIPAEFGVEYEWHCSYDPQAGKIQLGLQRDGAVVGVTMHEMSAEQRATKLKLNAFGISFRGFNDQESPLELVLDDLEYTASSDGKPRRQNCDQDPHWTGKGNLTEGHNFGYDPLATTKSRDGIPIAELLALPAHQRTEQQLFRLRQYYIRENAQDLLQLQHTLFVLRKEKEKVEQRAPLALIWEEMESPRATQVLARGDYQQPGETVDRNVPAAFPQLPSATKRDRLSLALWLVGGEHPLTSRVAVNRYWKLVFGAGLVRTPDDFGIRGEMPTHPELLDWLAVEFQTAHSDKPAWDVKRLMRLMVSSSTYQQSSNTSRILRENDPENRLLARGARFRLTAEEIRDAALTASGLLTRNIGGRSVFPYQPDHFYRDKEDDPNEWKWPVETGPELYRRGLYTFIRRTSPYPSFQTFDVSGRGECTVARTRTNTPLQALVTLNDPVFFEAARAMAERVLVEARPSERLNFLIRCALSRSPTTSEQPVLRRLYETELQRYQADPDSARKVQSQGRAIQTAGLDSVEVAAWTAVANAVLNLDESITRE